MESSSSDSNLVIEVDRIELQQLIVKLLQRKGMFAAEGEIVAERMIEADLQRRFGDGTGTLAEYLEAMDLGDIDPRARLITVNETAATAVLDGSTGMGHVAATRAVMMAAEKANAVGTATVVVKNSRPCGDLGGVASLAARLGLVGLVTTNFEEGGNDSGANHDLAWSIPSADQTAPIVHRHLSRGVAPSLQMLCGVLSASLSGAAQRKRKAVRVANSVDYGIIVVSPEKMGTRAAFMESLHFEPSPPVAVQLNCATVPLQAADAKRLSDLALKVKFPVSW